MIEQYLPIITFITGLAVGMAAIYVGFKLGFKASYEIRSLADETTEGKGLFPSKKDPGEFELIKDEDD